MVGDKVTQLKNKIKILVSENTVLCNQISAKDNTIRKSMRKSYRSGDNPN